MSKNGSLSLFRYSIVKLVVGFIEFNLSRNWNRYILTINFGWILKLFRDTVSNVICYIERVETTLTSRMWQ